MPCKNRFHTEFTESLSHYGVPSVAQLYNIKTNLLTNIWLPSFGFIPLHGILIFVRGKVIHNSSAKQLS